MGKREANITVRCCFYSLILPAAHPKFKMAGTGNQSGNHMASQLWEHSLLFLLSLLWGYQQILSLSKRGYERMDPETTDS